MTEVDEASDRQFAGFREQREFVEWLVGSRLFDRSGRARRVGQMGESDLAFEQALVALRNVLQLLADGDPVGGSTAGHVAARPDPVDWRDEALVVVLVGFGKRCRRL